ncbi:ATP-binding protein [Geodermatophilus maliterrae]|uniref:ATP-binding protein n=1 Tax=Geodermatophilus maliterrae TaxID=3162531 RepID=A0ABV3XB92_9ACTN
MRWFEQVGAGNGSTDAAYRDGDMDQELWPRRPRPESTGRQYEAEISQLSELRSVRAGLRAWVADALHRAGADGAVLDDLVVAVDELASNGLRHGRAPVLVRAVRTAAWVLLDVSDGDPHHGPEPALGRDPARGGMGLRIVAHLTVERGWAVAGDRKHVWACFPAG